MSKPIFPGTDNIKADEGLIMIKVLKQEECNAKQIVSFLEGVDDCLYMLKMSSVINRFRGKRKIGKSAADIIYERMMQIEI